MGKEVFNRYENKYKLNYETYQRLEEKLLDYMQLDEYNQNNQYYTISNLYYDTKDDYLIRNSLSRPKYKEKLRIRAYGIPTEDETVYLEIKKKYYGLVNKRRTFLKLKEAYDFIASGKKPELQPYMNKQVVNEIEYILSRYDLKAKLYLAYDRKAFFSKDSSSLRLTFDKNIRTRRYDLGLEMGDHGENLIEKEKCIMEIKVNNCVPVWLSQLLAECKVYRKSFSKYGAEYQTRLLNKRQEKGETGLCSNQYSIRPQLLPIYH